LVARRSLSLVCLLVPRGFVGAFMLTVHPAAVAAPPSAASIPVYDFTRAYVTALVEPKVQSATLPEDPPADAASAMARVHALEESMATIGKSPGR
jgi:hypothetical protein